MSNVCPKFGSKQLTEVGSPPEGHRVYTYGPWPSTLMAGQMQEAGYEELLRTDNGKKKRITFIGAFQGDLKAGEEVIVSFPGVHGAVWEFLTERGSHTQPAFHIQPAFSFPILMMAKRMALENTAKLGMKVAGATATFVLCCVTNKKAQMSTGTCDRFAPLACSEDANWARW